MSKTLLFKSDVLIIGAGIAGLSAALEAADRGLKVYILTKNENPVTFLTSLFKNFNNLYDYVYRYIIQCYTYFGKIRLDNFWVSFIHMLTPGDTFMMQ